MLNIGLRAHDYGTNVTVEKLTEILAPFQPVSIQLALEKSLSDAPQPGSINTGYARHVQQALQKQNIAVAVLGCYINPVHPNPDIRQTHLCRFKEHLRFARDFGCAMVGTETGSCNADCSWHPDTEKSATFDLFCLSLERLLNIAEKCGSIVAIEAVADQHVISTIEKVEQILRRCASPALKIIYDPVNLIPQAGLSEKQSEFFIRAFDAFGKDIAAVHAKDFRIENGRKIGALPAGTGELDYKSLLPLIMERKPGIDILLENTTPANGQAAINYLRQIAS